MRIRKSSIIGLAAIVMAGFAAYMYFASPLVALSGMKTALEQRDHEAFSDYIDFEQLRASLREELAAQAAVNAAESDNPLEQIGIAAGAAIADPLIDRLVTPTAIRIAFERRAAEKAEGEETDFFGELASDGSIERSGFGSFRLVTKEGVSFVFERNWFSWKLVAIQFAAPASTARSAQIVEDQVPPFGTDNGGVITGADDGMGHGGAVHRDVLASDCEEGDEFACEQLGEMAPGETYYQY
ncbi:DUF2939 domain-containing protein [Blastomonas sp. CCH8-A3]|uniref:DUF2939 domain-containing protein n=1 Tax=Blastomonas sp. CCH8-A3 TaxID=1768743 RepID=UPI0008246114|nr:DUF2939 domain-containing protein [Blastomonas sp. CCH8-A3]MBA4044707.1 DUF2939 domain-containing protein [Erythrobacter sp.]